MARPASIPPARAAAGAEDSAFRRRWTWRTRLGVLAAGWVIALVLRLLYRTLRVRLIDHGSWIARRAGGEQVLAAFWHDGIPLAPLIVARLGWPGRVTALLSWHRDAEIAAQALRRVGIRSVRGSVTRGWLGGVRGLLAARARGEDIVLVPDGPRGPRHRAKPGVLQLAQKTGLPLMVIGAAARPVGRLGSWDRMQLPAPFARVAIVLGGPVALPAERDAAVSALEEALAAANAEAEALVAGRAA